MEQIKYLEANKCPDTQMILILIKLKSLSLSKGSSLVCVV
jgi:hypothetical protein